VPATTHLDLTPFGFTPTESSAYRALIQRGPSSGYGIAQTLGVARANAYQALDGLVAKGAAVVAGEEPKLYRAVDPQALLAEASRRQAALLAGLERQLAALGGEGEPSTLRFSGERELLALMLRTAAVHAGPVRVVGPTDVLANAVPVWRKRAADGAPTELWPIGPAPSDFPVNLESPLNRQEVAHYFGGTPTILLTSDAAILARDAGSGPTGLWSSEPIHLGLARAAIDRLTTPKHQS
jgi:sugar-specific transcriptional regulator TrmB